MATLQGTAPETSDHNSTSAVTVTRTVDTGTNRCLLVLLQGEGNGTGVPSTWVSGITFDGVALSLVGRTRASQWSWSEIWQLVAPHQGVLSLAVTLTSTDVFRITTVVGQGVDQTTPLRTAVTATNDAATSASVTVLGVTADDLVVDGLSIDNTGMTPVIGAAQSLLLGNDLGAGVNTQRISSQAGVDGGVMSWTWTGSRPYSHVATAFVGAVDLAPPTIMMAPMSY